MASSNQLHNVCTSGTEQSLGTDDSGPGVSLGESPDEGVSAPTLRTADESYTSGDSSESHLSTETTADAFDTTSSCVDCDSEDFEQSSSGEWYCADCGLLQSTSEIEFTEPGWTAIEERRTSPSSGPSRLGVGTLIGSPESGQTPRWAQYNTRLSHEHQTLRHGLKELRAVAAALESNESLTDQAATLFRRAADEGLLVGQSLEAIAAACLHAVGRERQRPFPTKQVAEVSPVDCGSIRSAYSKLVQEFGLQLIPPEPTSFIPRFAADAGLSQEVRRQATELAELVIEDEAHVGQSPTGVAAAALYGAAKQCGESVTQEELAEIAYVSVVTLSRQWQTIQTYLDSERHSSIGSRPQVC